MSFLKPTTISCAMIVSPWVWCCYCLRRVTPIAACLTSRPEHVAVKRSCFTSVASLYRVLRRRGLGRRSLRLKYLRLYLRLTLFSATPVFGLLQLSLYLRVELVDLLPELALAVGVRLRLLGLELGHVGL